MADLMKECFGNIIQRGFWDVGIIIANYFEV